MSNSFFTCKDMGPVVPTTPLIIFLERLQETALSTFGERNFDPKLYVDLSLNFNLSTTEKAFNGLPRNENGTVSIKDLEEFLAMYFQDAGKDLVYYDPPDFLPEPDGFLPKVKNPEVKAWALEVHSLWKNLSRKLSDEVRKQPELHTMLPLRAPVIVPGSRFREVYYWDSYWTIRLVRRFWLFTEFFLFLCTFVYIFLEFLHLERPSFPFGIREGFRFNFGHCPFVRISFLLKK